MSKSCKVPTERTPKRRLGRAYTFFSVCWPTSYLAHSYEATTKKEDLAHKESKKKETWPTQTWPTIYCTYVYVSKQEKKKAPGPLPNIEQSNLAHFQAQKKVQKLVNFYSEHYIFLNQKPTFYFLHFLNFLVLDLHSLFKIRKKLRATFRTKGVLKQC